MSIRSTEDYIKLNVKNLPINVNGYYICIYIFIFNESNSSVSLYKLNPNSNGITGYVSRNSNFASNNHVNLNNGVTATFIADVGFLFPHITGSSLRSSYGCSSFDSVSQDHQLTWNYTINETKTAKLWSLAHNGEILNDSYYVSEISFYLGNYVAYTPSFGSGKDFPYNLSSAQSFVISEFVKDGYPSSGGGTSFYNYNQYLSSYLTCLGSNDERCCLEYC